MLLNDGVRNHPKVHAAGGEASWLWAAAIDYCREQLTDGFVSNEALRTLGVYKTPIPKLVIRCLAAGLFDAALGGVRVHDFLVHNNSKVEVEQKRRDAALRKAGWREEQRTGRERHEDPRVPPQERSGLTIVPPGQTMDSRVTRPCAYPQVGVGIGDLSGSEEGCGEDSKPLPDVLQARWLPEHLAATGVKGRVRPAHDTGAFIELAQRYGSVEEVFRRARLMWASPSYAHMTRNPKLLIELAPELDRWILDHGDEPMNGRKPEARPVRNDLPLNEWVCPHGGSHQAQWRCEQFDAMAAQRAKESA